MNLIEAMRSENAKSKKWYRNRIIFNLAALIFSSATIYNSSSLVSFLLFFFPALSFVATELSLKKQNKAEYIRNLLILKNSTDYKPSDLELKQLQLDIGKLDKSEPSYTKPYYDSSLPLGLKRLAENIAESVYFTINLSKRVAVVYALAIFCTLVVILVSACASLQLGLTAATGKVISQCIALLVMFLVTGDFAILFLRYFYLYGICNKILEKSEVLKKQENPNVIEVMNVLDEYNCARAQCPPIPSWIYSQMRDALNKSWRIKVNA